MRLLGQTYLFLIYFFKGVLILSRLVSLFREILRNVEIGLLAEEFIKQGYPAKEALRKAQLMVTQPAHANRATHSIGKGDKPQRGSSRLDREEKGDKL